ncbi:MAG: hypothetical protein QXI32_04790 [Candidatus Bathyarchaeia archaeon]
MSSLNLRVVELGADELDILSMVVTAINALRRLHPFFAIRLAPRSAISKATITTVSC